MYNVNNLWTPKELAKRLNINSETIRIWEKKGKIKAIKTSGGHRRYIYDDKTQYTTQKRNIIYTRVSSNKQKYDLERQIAFLQKEYPNFEVIKDIGSGLNFKRRGFLSLLEAVFKGTIQQIVVAHKDRLCRFGFDLLEKLFIYQGVTITVMSNAHIKEPIRELAEDLLSIITVFSARYYGSRKYSILSETKDLPKQRPKRTIQQMPRRIKVFLQQKRSINTKETKPK
jgi:excisionase family DNA binding protein